MDHGFSFYENNEQTELDPVFYDNIPLSSTQKAGSNPPFISENTYEPSGEDKNSENGRISQEGSQNIQEASSVTSIKKDSTEDPSLFDRIKRVFTSKKCWATALVLSTLAGAVLGAFGGIAFERSRRAEITPTLCTFVNVSNETIAAPFVHRNVSSTIPKEVNFTRLPVELETRPHTTPTFTESNLTKPSKKPTTRPPINLNSADNCYKSCSKANSSVGIPLELDATCPRIKTI